MSDKGTKDRAEEHSRPRRRGIVTALLIFATIRAFSIWANRQALNTTNWTNTTELLGTGATPNG
ncbi:MAG: hypothetical protein H0V41_08845 [Pseudonocardiales bacterium]|nr:hypothetical protein [Pseudonocardiales bacterium]